MISTNPATRSSVVLMVSHFFPTLKDQIVSFSKETREDESEIGEIGWAVISSPALPVLGVKDILIFYNLDMSTALLDDQCLADIGSALVFALDFSVVSSHPS